MRGRFAFTPGVLLRFAAWLLPVAALLVLSSVVLERRELAADRALHGQRSRTVVDVGSAVVARDLESVAAEVRYLASQSILQDYLAGRPGARARLEAEYVAFSRFKAVYDQIRFIDSSGRERVRVNHDDGDPHAVPEAELQSKAGRDYFAESLATPAGQVYVSVFDLNVEHEQIERPLKPVIRFGTPIVVDGERRGVLVLNYLGARLLRAVSESASAFSGQVTLVNFDGFYLLHPGAPQDEWGFQLGGGRRFGDDHPRAWPAVSAEHDGQVETPGGLFTFRSVGGEWAPRGGLLLVARVSPERLRAGAAALLRKMLVGYAAVSPLLVGLVAVLAVAGAVRRKHELQIAESEARLRTLSAKLLTTQEEERRSISRDLHDDLGQFVTAIGLNLERAKQTPDVDKKDRLAGQALEGTKALMERVREISTRLRPRMLDDLGLKEAARSFLDDCRARLGVTAEAELRFERAELPPEVSENVYRILQEAVTNVARHSGSPAVQVRLDVAEREVRLTVRDRGAGFDPGAQSAESLGLLGMRERVELLGGTFRLSSAPGGGTEIDARLPLPPR